MMTMRGRAEERGPKAFQAVPLPGTVAAGVVETTTITQGEETSPGGVSYFPPL